MGDFMISEIIQNIVVNILTILVSVLLAAIAYFIVYEIQHSKFMKDIRRFIRPSKRVFVTDKVPTKFSIQDTNFHKVLSDEEQKILLDFECKANLFNGTVIRLDKLTRNTATLSRVRFFDFMTTNLVVKPASKRKMPFYKALYLNFFDKRNKEFHSLEGKVKSAVLPYRKKSFDDVLAINELANIVTVSVLLEDREGNVLLVKRGSNVAVSSGMFATSCTGSLSDEDLETDNPFISCAERELKEELNLQCDLSIEQVVISKQKLQPAVLLTGKIDRSFQSVYGTMSSAQDFNVENQTLYSVPKTQLAGIVKHYQFTDVAAYQLAGNCDSWFFVPNVNIEMYALHSLI